MTIEEIRERMPEIVDEMDQPTNVTDPAYLRQLLGEMADAIGSIARRLPKSSTSTTPE